MSSGVFSVSIGDGHSPHSTKGNAGVLLKKGAVFCMFIQAVLQARSGDRGSAEWVRSRWTVSQQLGFWAHLETETTAMLGT